LRRALLAAENRELLGRWPVSTLVVAEHLRGELRPITLELITAAQELGEPVVVAVIGNDPSALANQVDVPGVAEIVTVTVEQEEFENDVLQQAVEAVIEAKQPKVVLLGFTINSMGYGPALATKLGTGFASDVFGLSNEGDEVVATRAFYSSKVHAEVEFPGSERVILLLRPTAWVPAEGEGSAAKEALDVPIDGSRARHEDFVEVATGDVDITTADFLLSVGRGIGDKENLPQFEELADKMGATLSVSRPIVDQGWMPNSRQVGQSGKTVKPKVYLALGISGAVQHLAGMKTSGTIIAVNSDPEAAIFSIAHYGAVADLFEVAEELEKLY
jgi:electron transfer flavoprotein alpha subunit